MNGYSSHTYMWVNAEDERFWVKYHFKSDQGVECLTQADADRIAGEDADYHQRDLYEAIERGEFPSWTLQMQIMPFEDAKTTASTPSTSPRSGRTATTRWSTWAAHPGPQRHRLPHRNRAGGVPAQQHVPGTGLSPDKMLLARGFSYADAHRARLGVNYQQIPVNRPHSPVRSYSKDGAMRVDNVTDPVYYPNSFEDAPAADEHTYAEHAVWAADGEMVRAAYTLHAEDDDFGQANTLINDVMDDAARDRLVETVSGLLAGLRREEVRPRAFEYWRAIDKGVGDRIEAAALRSERS